MAAFGVGAGVEAGLRLRLLRRADRDLTGRVEEVDLAAAYDEYFANMLTMAELEQLVAAWFTGEHFQPRRVALHVGDFFPTARARTTGTRRRAVHVEPPPTWT